MLTAGPFTVSILLTGATQFVSTTPIVTFNEAMSLDTLPSNYYAKIMGFSYTSSGASHAVTMYLASILGSVSANATQRIILEPTDPAATTVSRFTVMCNSPVPRTFGWYATAQPPALANLITNLTSYRLFFATTGKAADATITVWYGIWNGE